MLADLEKNISWKYEWMNQWCFRPRLRSARLNWTGDNLGEWGEFLLWILPLEQDRSFDLLASSPAHYHCTTDASHLMEVVTYKREYSIYKSNALTLVFVLLTGMLWWNQNKSLLVQSCPEDHRNDTARKECSGLQRMKSCLVSLVERQHTRQFKWDEEWGSGQSLHSGNALNCRSTGRYCSEDMTRTKFHLIISVLV